MIKKVIRFGREKECPSTSRSVDFFVSLFESSNENLSNCAINLCLIRYAYYTKMTYKPKIQQYIAYLIGTWAIPINNKDDSVDNYIRSILELLKVTMPNGIPDLGIPPLDPFEVPHFEIDHIS